MEEICEQLYFFFVFFDKELSDTIIIKIKSNFFFFYIGHLVYVHILLPQHVLITNHTLKGTLSVNFNTILTHTFRCIFHFNS